MATFEVICSNCSRVLTAPAEAVGRRVQCPGCGMIFELKPPPTRPPEIVFEPAAPAAIRPEPAAAACPTTPPPAPEPGIEFQPDAPAAPAAVPPGITPPPAGSTPTEPAAGSDAPSTEMSFGPLQAAHTPAAPTWPPGGGVDLSEIARTVAQRPQSTAALGGHPAWGTVRRGLLGVHIAAITGAAALGVLLILVGLMQAASLGAPGSLPARTVHPLLPYVQGIAQLCALALAGAVITALVGQGTCLAAPRGLELGSVSGWAFGCFLTWAAWVGVLWAVVLNSPLLYDSQGLLVCSFWGLPILLAVCITLFSVFMSRIGRLFADADLPAKCKRLIIFVWTALAVLVAGGMCIASGGAGSGVAFVAVLYSLLIPGALLLALLGVMRLTRIARAVIAQGQTAAYRVEPGLLPPSAFAPPSTPGAPGPPTPPAPPGLT